jgi:Luciferase-like monooxygenase
MRVGVALDYSGGFHETVDHVVELEKVGVDIAMVAEAYSYDAVSRLGYLAAATSTIELGSGVLPIYSRTPSLLAMTAAGLDYVSNGRFRLGIGTSGPQVIEGFHGVPFDAPLGRTREVVDICRQVWRRERVPYDGAYYTIPLPPERGTGLGKPLQLINHPVRARIPITIAALGPKNVELTAEIAEGWQPSFVYPEKVDVVWGEAPSRRVCQARPHSGYSGRHRPGESGHRRRHRGSAGVGETHTGALHRRHGRARPPFLPRPGHPLRLRRGGQPCPAPLSRRQKGRGRRCRAGRLGAAHVAGRPARFHQGTRRGLCRGRGYHTAGESPDRAPPRVPALRRGTAGPAAVEGVH